MSISDALKVLVEVGKVDGAIALANAKKREIETDLSKRREAIKAALSKRDAKKKAVDEQRKRYQKEESTIEFERSKLVDRRKALASLNNYKLQQAAEKEIEFTAKQLSQREDVLLQAMGQVEKGDAEIVEMEKVCQGISSELEAVEKEAAGTIADITTRLSEFSERRAELLRDFPHPQALKVYDKVKDRFPSDPIVPLIGRESCSGCHMRIGPQVFVQLSKGEIVKCPGCGRILRLEDAAQAA